MIQKQSIIRKFNKNTTLELVEESEYKRLKELLNQMNINDNISQQVL